MHDTQPRDRLIRVYGDSLSLPRARGGIGHRQTCSEVLHERYLHGCEYFGASAHQILVIHPRGNPALVRSPIATVSAALRRPSEGT